MKDNDKDLTPLMGPGQGEKEMLLVDLLAELMPTALSLWSSVVDDAAENDRVAHGRNEDFLGRLSSRKATKNVLRNLIDGYSARIVEGHTAHKAFPSHPEAVDKNTATFANHFLEGWRSDEQFHSREYEFAGNGQKHGTAFWKVLWDTSAGEVILADEVDENDVPVLDDNFDKVVVQVGHDGAVRCEITDVFETVFGPGNDIGRAEWAIQRVMKSRDEARAMLHAAGLDEAMLPTPLKYTNTLGAMSVGYALWEVWYRPGPRFEKGLMGTLLSASVVLEVRDYPYSHGQLPFIPWSPDLVAKSCFGDSHVFDNVPLQKELDYVEGRKNQIMHTMAGVLMHAPSELMGQIKDGEDHLVEVRDQGELALLGFKMMDGMPHMLAQRSGEIESYMYNVAGLNEIFQGASNIKAGTSAKSYEFLGRGDKMKTAPAAARFRHSTFLRDSQALRLFQQFAKTERKVAVFGPDSEPFVASFDGARLDGTMVILEPVAGADLARATSAAGAPENAQMGLLPAGDVSEVAQTGLPSTLMAGRLRGRMTELIQQGILDGNDQVQPDGSIPAQIAIDELNRWTAVDGVNRLRIDQWIEFYKQQLQQQQQQVPQ